MACINLYKIDPNKVEECIKNLPPLCGTTITIDKDVDSKKYQYCSKLYFEAGASLNEHISWNWLLEAFQADSVQVYRAPKAVLVIERKNSENILLETYAITFGSSYFKIDKYCERDFGLDFADRMEYTNIKTTTLTAPNLKRNKTVNTYKDYNDLDFDSGESVSKLKVNASLGENFTIFKPSVEIGNSIRFIIDDETIEGIVKVIQYVESILTHDVLQKIPKLRPVKDGELLSSLNKKLDYALQDALLGMEEGNILFLIPELEIIGANEIFQNADDRFMLKYYSVKKEICNLTIKTIRDFCRGNNINNIDKINKIKIVRYRDEQPVVTVSLRSIIEYTDDDNSCVLDGGRWYKYNQEYINYLNESVNKVCIGDYNPNYNFTDEIYNEFIIKKLYEGKHNECPEIERQNKINKLKRKYYKERCFNIIRGGEEDYDNYDRAVKDGFEKMDLYEKNTNTMFSVKIGGTSSALCYAVDQSLTSLKKYIHGEWDQELSIERVGLWFILERETQLQLISELKMLMLKNRIDQWRKAVTLTGLKPVIYVNYRKDFDDNGRQHEISNA